MHNAVHTNNGASLASRRASARRSRAATVRRMSNQLDFLENWHHDLMLTNSSSCDQWTLDCYSSNPSRTALVLSGMNCEFFAVSDYEKLLAQRNQIWGLKVEC